MTTRQSFLSTIDSWVTRLFSDGLPGVPYIWGGKNPETGLDCSGCITAAGEIAGLFTTGFGLNHNAASLADLLSPIEALDIQPGDLAFYGPSAQTIDHVMACVGDGRVIGSSGGGASCTTIGVARRKGAGVHYRSTVEYRPDLIGYRRLM